MWKVIAADDEGYIREALQKLINWESPVAKAAPAVPIPRVKSVMDRNYWRRSGEKCRTL